MPIHANAIAIMAKAPTAGSVKTRLVPPLTAEQAAELYRALLLDQLQQLAGVDNAERYLAYTPVNSEDSFRLLAGDHFRYLPQRGDDLGARMENLCADLFKLGHRNVIIMGSDLPGLPLEFVSQSFVQLSKTAGHMVLGPSRDGGYYLIGMNHPTPEVFANMTWSHDRVLADTIARIECLGVPYSLLPAWFDLDRAEDLEYLRDVKPEWRAGFRRTLDYLTSLGYGISSAV
jgi:uncharacterized protein